MGRNSSRALALALWLVGCGGAEPPPTIAVPVAPVPEPEGTPFLDPVALEPPAIAPTETRTAVLPRRMIGPEENDANRVRYTPDGRFWVMLDYSGLVILRDANDDIRAVHRLALSVLDRGVVHALSPDGARAVISAAGRGSATAIFDFHADRMIPISVEDDLQFDVLTDPNVTRVAFMRYDESEDTHVTEVFDARGERVCTVPANAIVSADVMNADGSKMFEMSASGIKMVDTATCEVTRVTEVASVHYAMRPTGGQMLVLENRELVARSPRDGHELGRIPFDLASATIRYDETGRCAMIHDNERLAVVEAATGRVRHAFVRLAHMPRELDTDCDHVRRSGGVHELVTDLRTGEERQEPRPGAEEEEGGARFNDARFHSIWSVLLEPAHGNALIGTRGAVMLLDATTARRTCGSGQELWRMPSDRVLARKDGRFCDVHDGSTLPGRAYVVSESGRYGLVGEEDDDGRLTGRVFVHDFVARAQTPPVPSLTEVPDASDDELSFDMGLSDDGRYLSMSGGESEAVEVVDVRTGRELLRVEVPYARSWFPIGARSVVVWQEGDVFAYPLPSGRRPRRIGRSGRSSVHTMRYVRLASSGSEDEPTSLSVFMDVRSGTERIVPGPMVIPTGGDFVVTQHSASFMVEDLVTGEGPLFDGTFLAATRDMRVLVRCHDGVLRVHGLSAPLATDREGDARGPCPERDVRLGLRDDGKVLIERGSAETRLTRLDDGTRMRVRMLIGDGEIVYVLDEDEGVHVLAGDPAMLVRRAAGSALTAELSAIVPSAETRRRWERVLAP